MTKKDKIIVIGSGASASQAALTLLELGQEVLMLDIGVEEEEVPFPDIPFNNLSDELDNSAKYLLGENYEGIVFPSDKALYSYPPNRRYLAAMRDLLTPYRGEDFKAFLSHARGGLAIGWGANCLEYDDSDLMDFPIKRKDLEETYRIVGNRIGVCGTDKDRLGKYLPTSISLMKPLGLGAHENTMYSAYERKAERLKKAFGFFMGHSRMAVLTEPRDSRKACTYCSRCIWGCGQKSIYDPRQTLEKCKLYDKFTYRSGFLVTHLISVDNRVSGVSGIEISSGYRHIFSSNKVVLAAGAISSGAIFLRTLRNDSQLQDYWKSYELKTKSIMDTKVIRVPYIQLKMMGRNHTEPDFQFNRLNVAYLSSDECGRNIYVHGEIISLHGLLIHPLLNKLPFGYRAGLNIFKFLESSLGAVTIFLPDRPQNGNYLTIEDYSDSLMKDRILIKYQDSEFANSLEQNVTAKTRKILWELGCVAPSSMASSYISGSGLHYAGTIPMSEKYDILTVDPYCQSYRYKNLFVVDGSVFPALPSKSITFSLMANAVRVARRITEL